jgi:phosphate uptake regulator
MSDGHGHDLPGPLEPAAPEDAVPWLAGYIVNGLFSIGLSLESARSIVGSGPAGDRIAAATDEVDRMIRDIRTALSGLPEDRPAALEERIARTARALQVTALEAVARLERQADRAMRPGRLDYRAEIKRWEAFADHAEQMAKHWEQSPQPEAPRDTDQDRD